MKKYMLSPEMRDRFKAEADKNGRYDYQVAEEYLHVTSKTYSAWMRGKNPIGEDYVKKLADLWGVRENYLLCIDDIRTDTEYYDAYHKNLSNRQRAIWEALPVYGYEFEYIDQADTNNDCVVRISKNGVCYGCISSADFVKINELLEVSVQNLFETVLYINRYDMYCNDHNAISPFDRTIPFNNSIWNRKDNRDIGV